MKPQTTAQKPLVVITEFFYPSTSATAQLTTDLVNYLSSNGLSCTVITSTAGQSASLASSCKIIRSSDSLTASSSLLTKFYSGLRFFLFALFWCLTSAPPDSKILIISNPPFIGIIGPIVKSLKGLSYIFLLQDVFPRSAVLSGIIPAVGPVEASLRYILHIVCQRSHATVVLTQAMKDRVVRDFHLAHSKISVIHNWAVEKGTLLPKNQNQLAQKWGTVNTFTVMYSGNLGRLHELSTLLEAARLTIDLPIKYLFVGGGARYKQIAAYISELNLTNVTIYPYQPRELLPLSLGCCDVSCIGLVPGSQDTVAPSKFYGIIASGKPVLLISNEESELAEFIVKHNIGIVVSQGDASTLVEEIKNLLENPAKLQKLSDNSKNVYDTFFGYERSAQEYLSLIQNMYKD